MKEVWKDAPGFEGIFQVSNHGRIRRADPVGGWVYQRPMVQPSGHLRIGRLIDGKVRREYVHRLVAMVFLESSPKPFVLHNDGNPANNMVANLRWGTHAENMADAVKHGKHYTVRLTHCQRGHEMTDDNLLVRKSEKGDWLTRKCRACSNARSRRYAAAKRARS